MISQCVESMIGISLGGDVGVALQIINQTRLQDIAGSIAFTFFNGRSNSIMAAINHTDDTVDLGRLKVFFEGGYFQLATSVPMIKLKWATSNRIIVGIV